MLQWFWNLLSHLPLRAMYVLSDVLFPPFYHLVRYRRRIVRRNLTGSFPEKSRAEIIKIERKFYRFFIDMVFEMCRMATIPKAEMSRRMRFTNVEEIDAVLTEGRSVALYLGHLGNWEWVSSMPLHLPHGVVAAQVYRQLKSEAADRLLIRQRERMGAECVEMRDIARRMGRFAEERQTGIVGFIADQSPRMRNIRHHVEFLGHTAPVLVGAEKLTKRYGLEAWYLDVRRVGRGYYEAEFVRLSSDTHAMPDWALTDLYYAHLERSVRRRPELYLWAHNRFKYAKKP